MIVYRAHIIGGDGRFMNSIDLPFDEVSTIEFAKRLAKDGCDVELWNGTRKIATFKSDK